MSGKRYDVQMFVCGMKLMTVQLVRSLIFTRMREQFRVLALFVRKLCHMYTVGYCNKVGVRGAMKIVPGD